MADEIQTEDFSEDALFTGIGDVTELPADSFMPPEEEESTEALTEESAAEEPAPEPAQPSVDELQAKITQLEREKGGLYAEVRRERGQRQSLQEQINERLGALEEQLTPPPEEEPLPPLEGEPDQVADALAERFNRKVRPDLAQINERQERLEQRINQREQAEIEQRQNARVQTFLDDQRSGATDEQRQVFDARQAEVKQHYLGQGYSDEEADYWTGHYFIAPALAQAVQTGKNLYEHVHQELTGGAAAPPAASPPAAAGSPAVTTPAPSPAVQQHRANVASAPKPAPEGRSPETGENPIQAFARALPRMSDDQYAKGINQLAAKLKLPVDEVADLVDEAGYAQAHAM